MSSTTSRKAADAPLGKHLGIDVYNSIESNRIAHDRINSLLTCFHINITHHTAPSLGMMDGAYFISRTEIIDFFNSLLQMNLAKIEQTATGAVACQLMDYIFPGSIPMKRVNWEAKSDFQYIENYKILQAAFTKQNVQKVIDVDRLVRAKYQDNLEFCQWLKAFFEHACSETREDYDPIARRKIGKGGKKLDEIFLPRGVKNTRPPSSSSSVSSSRTRSVKAPPSSGASVSSVRSASSKSTTATTAQSRRSTVTAPLRDKNSRPSAKQSISTAAAKQVEKLESQNEELGSKNAQLRRKCAETELILESIEKERDFYFDKLRGIEVMLQVHEEDDGKDSEPEALIQRVFKVLYAKIEDNILVTDDGELLEDMADGQEDLLNETTISMLSVDQDEKEVNSFVAANVGDTTMLGIDP
jgi:RP/EB family microtubule-associated protein